MEYGDMTVQDEAVILPNHAMGIFIRDMTLASGNQSIVGLGFRPSIVHFIGQKTTEISQSIGWDNGSTKFCLFALDGAVTVGWNQISGMSIRLDTGSSDFQEGFIASFDIDGFTITWARTGSPSAGQGNFKFTAFK